MKTLINGRWTDRKDEKQSNDGSFKRKDTEFRNWITPDGSPGETGVGGFKAESGRYHLYVSLACPWAHRTLIFRKLKNLEPHIGVSIVNPIMLKNGWEFYQLNETEEFGVKFGFMDNCPYPEFGSQHEAELEEVTAARAESFDVWELAPPQGWEWLEKEN